MKLLHSKSIRNCTELEEAIHQAEVERFSEMIASLPIMIVTLMSLLKMTTTKK